MAKKKKKKNKSVNIYQPEPIRALGPPGQYQRPNYTPQTFTAKKQRELLAQKSSKRDQLYRQIGTYSAGAVQDAARRAGINANATSAKEAQSILAQLQRPTVSAPRPAPPPSAPAAPPRPAPSAAPTTQYSSQINSMASNLLAQQRAADQRYAQEQAARRAQEQANLQAFNERFSQQQKAFDDRFSQQQTNFQNMMIQFRDKANEQAMAAEKRVQDMMIAQKEAEERAAAAREAAAAKAAADAARAKVTQQTTIANQMRAASASPQLKFGSTETGAGMYGTRPFKRRADLAPSVAQGITNRLGTNYGGINV
jgi:hypothetical protein